MGRLSIEHINATELYVNVLQWKYWWDGLLYLYISVLQRKAQDVTKKKKKKKKKHSVFQDYFHLWSDAPLHDALWRDTMRRDEGQGTPTRDLTLITDKVTIWFCPFGRNILDGNFNMYVYFFRKKKKKKKKTWIRSPTKLA